MTGRSPSFLPYTLSSMAESFSSIVCPDDSERVEDETVGTDITGGVDVTGGVDITGGADVTGGAGLGETDDAEDADGGTAVVGAVVAVVVCEEVSLAGGDDEVELDGLNMIVPDPYVCFF